MTSTMIKEIIKWILDHQENLESIKTLLRHVYLPIKLTEEQLEDLLARLTKVKVNEKELKKISEEVARLSDENIRQMFV